MKRNEEEKDVRRTEVIQIVSESVVFVKVEKMQEGAGRVSVNT